MPLPEHDLAGIRHWTVTYTIVGCICGWTSMQWSDPQDAFDELDDHCRKCDNIIPLFKTS